MEPSDMLKHFYSREIRVGQFLDESLSQFILMIAWKSSLLTPTHITSVENFEKILSENKSNCNEWKNRSATLIINLIIKLTNYFDLKI